MDLEAYLSKNEGLVKIESCHSRFVDFISENLDIFGIAEPYTQFREVSLFEETQVKVKTKSKKSEVKVKTKIKTLSQSDLIILNSDFYIFEAKTIQINGEDPHRRERSKIKDIGKQLSLAYSYFNKRFNIKPVLIGAYKQQTDSDFFYFHQNPDGSAPRLEDISKVPC